MLRVFYLVCSHVECGGDLPVFLGLEVVLEGPLGVEVLPTGRAVTVRCLNLP